MYLKEIEISGFKSFADKITLNLDNKITCIVGPNGSGKSNIVDAIRFVLGEQSVKSLRGDNLMSDVIFGGSKNREQMHSATVALTFDNSDNYINTPYKTVSVRRRLYKTGDNEYYLNNEKCRLKDIIDLFLDSNIGKSSYNIIGQGEIAKILSNSPYERRSVIEEAAGILKYKKRREEAIKKLDKTNLNLDRINDIINEVEDRLEPLKIQSEKAQKYIEAKNNLDKLEIALLSEEITNANLEYQNIKKTITNKEEDLLILSNNINDPEIDKLKIKETELSKKIQDLNTDLLNKTKEKEELNSLRKISKERNKYDSKDIKVFENIEYLKDKKLSNEKDIKIYNNDLEKNNKQKQELEIVLNDLIDNLNDNKSKHDILTKDYNNLSKDILTLKNKIDILNNNIKENSYLNNTVKKVLDNPKLTGIIDALINVVEIDNKYQKAFDVVSISNRNFLIAEDDLSIKKAIEYLKNNNLGRATFLPIKVIKPKYVDLDTLELLKDKDGYLGTLNEFIKYDSKFKDIILNQYGNIIVVDNIDNATKLTKIIANKYRIVTLSGEVIHIGGSVTGGSVNDLKNNLNLKNKINELNLELIEKENNLSHLETEIVTIQNNINDIDRNIYEKRSLLIKVIDDINKLKTNLNNLNKETIEIDQELNSLEGNTNSSEYDNDYYNKSLECDLITKNIKDLIKEQDELNIKINELEGINKENRLNYSNLDKELNELKIKMSKLDMVLDNNLNILNSEYNITYERAVKEYTLDMDIIEAKKLLSNYKNIIKDIGMVSIDSIDEYKSVSERYNYLSSERDDLFKAKDMLYSIIDDMDEVMKSDFITTFNLLKEEFKNVFRDLFKGGDANLELTDPDNILETGVDIIASPPGKKLKTITLLSGGEKTLTAISLLFAILNIRKVPFCVFDEIEAALDEANVDTFGEYLKSYQDKTQFLLITHKKRTMEYANTLYGITMQESGISKLVSVKLEENN